MLFAEDQSHEKVYLEFESAYLSNSVDQFKPWLSDKYSLTQTLHIPEVGADSRTVSQDVLLKSMKSINKPNTTPRSILENIKIESMEGNKFCGVSETKNIVSVSGEKYEEFEIRKVCFEPTNSKYKAYSHEINIHYSAN